ncbi:MAG TPA: polymer-forming cytoskeletal protein [Clostridiaceae bacterium]
MLTKQKNTTSQQPSQRGSIETLIGSSAIITGNITSSGMIRIDGVLDGDLASDAEVIIGDGGKVTGDITAFKVSIGGNVRGNIKCKDVLEIMSTGHLIGDIEVMHFSVENGAMFNGNCNILSGDNSQVAASEETD